MRKRLLLVPLVLAGCGASSPTASSGPTSSLASRLLTVCAEPEGPSSTLPPEGDKDCLTKLSSAIRDEIGDEVFAGSSLGADDNDNDNLTIYATRPELASDAVARLGGSLHDRVVVERVRLSARELHFAVRDAQARLDQAGIDGEAAIVWGEDAVVVRLFTHEGTVDPEAASAAREAVTGVPVTILFDQRPTPLSP